MSEDIRHLIDEEECALIYLKANIQTHTRLLEDVIMHMNAMEKTVDKTIAKLEEKRLIYRESK